jgi:hypothetical protein
VTVRAAGAVFARRKKAKIGARARAVAMAIDR